MTRYLIHHRHEARECGVAYASFRGHESSLRHNAALSSCDSGGHAIWWTVDAATEGGCARAAAVLHRRARHRRSGHRSGDPVQSKEEQMSGTNTPYSRRWQALIVLAMSLLIVSVDNTILNVGLPTIRDGARRELQPAAVDRGQLPARVRRAAPDRRLPR